MKKIIIIVFALLIATPVFGATTNFIADADITVSGVIGGVTADLTIESGSQAGSWTFSSGTFTVVDPDGTNVFKVTAISSTVKGIKAVLNGVTDVCVKNTTPGTTYLQLPNTLGTFTITPIATDLANTVTYNSKCGAATCDSGYETQGSGSGSTCTLQGGGGGGGGGGGTPATPTSVSTSNGSLSVSTTQAGTLNQSFSDSSSVQLDIPRGSITQTTTFSASQGSLTGGLVPADTMGAILIGNTVFNVSAQNSSGQSVTSFSGDLTITLTIPDLTEGSDLGVYYFNTTLGKWELIPGAVFNFVTKEVVFTVNHLTRFGVFEIAGLPEYIETEEGAIADDSFWTSGRWVKTEDRTTVYFVDNSDTRHAYPNQSIWESYFGTDFSFVETISAEELASYPLDRNVPYNAGILLKIPSIPKVYRVGNDRLIQWIASEAKAIELYGVDWADLVKDLSDAFFGDYVRGDAIE